MSTANPASPASPASSTSPTSSASSSSPARPASPAGTDRVLPLVRLTDEELVLMGASHPAVAAPFLDGLDPAGRQVATQVAYRSLCAHGLEPTADGTALVVPEGVVSMMQVRAAARAVLFVSRTTPDGQLVRYHHVGDQIVVLEDVAGDGVHDFALVDHDGLSAALREFVAADGAADGAGPPVVITADALAAGEIDEAPWGEVVAQLDVTVWRPHTCDDDGPPVLLGFLLGRRGSWCSRNVAGDKAPIELHPVRPAEVAGAIEALMRA
ncbi:hypothetical protein [Flexivirga aerilata]|uniref:hypothetical protein n=1 Tax=Flexivirga aerilata TaxID=1656889 RepID=UPI001FE7FF97|nr:hypothetical protein [Flexivirga aerilata]